MDPDQTAPIGAVWSGSTLFVKGASKTFQQRTRQTNFVVFLFDLILYVPSTIFQLYRDRSYWVEPVLSWDKCVLLKDHNAVTPVRLEPAALRSQVKPSTIEPLRSNNFCCDKGDWYQLNEIVFIIELSKKYLYLLFYWPSIIYFFFDEINVLKAINFELKLSLIYKFRRKLIYHIHLVRCTLHWKWAVTCDFQQYGSLTSVDSDKPVQPPFQLRSSKLCLVSSLTVIEYSRV